MLDQEYAQFAALTDTSYPIRSLDFREICAAIGWGMTIPGKGM
ncbi:MAG: hypothetical protein ACKO4R_02250 [Synechococcales cyanobacterium]